VGNLRLVVVFLVLAFSSRLFADQVVLKNGDRLTGTIVKSDGKALIIKTEFAGDVTVQWPAIQEINSTQSLHVGLNNGQTVVGRRSWLSRHQRQSHHSGFAWWTELHPRELHHVQPQFCRTHTGRGALSEAGCIHCAYAEVVLLPRPQRHQPVSRSV
jgi:hypothetical protein